MQEVVEEVVSKIPPFKPQAPEDYWLLTLDEQAGNGCGPDLVQRGVFRVFLGPNSFFKDSCGVHNYQYSLLDPTEASEDHRRIADDLFLKNMLAQCADIKSWFVRRWRIMHAYAFYHLCRIFGCNFYKKGK